MRNEVVAGLGEYWGKTGMPEDAEAIAVAIAREPEAWRTLLVDPQERETEGDRPSPDTPRANAKSVSGQCGGQDPGPVSALPVMDNARDRPDSPDPRDFAFALHWQLVGALFHFR